MLAHSDLQRSIRAMTIGMAERMHARRHQADNYGLAEREQQFQYEVAGKVGTLPVETTIKINFQICYQADSGNQRDGTLDRPQVRLGFEQEYGPKGLLHYAKITEWKYDDDFNFIGASLLVGVHCPAVAIEGLLISQARFKLAVHVGFHGFGSVIDPEGNYDAGGNIDIPDWSGTTH